MLSDGDSLFPIYMLLFICNFGELQLSYVFDNTSTVIFAAMMSIFATLFLEGWKRYHAEVAWKWGLLDFEVDEVLYTFFLLKIIANVYIGNKITDSVSL